jgi:hypothetical protein
MKIAAEEWDLRTKQNSDDHLTQSVKGDCANNQTRYAYPAVFIFCSNYW